MLSPVQDLEEYLMEEYILKDSKPIKHEKVEGRNTGYIITCIITISIVIVTLYLLWRATT